MGLSARRATVGTVYDISFQFALHVCHGFAVRTRAQMTYQDSAQSFVRALRAPTDPPRQGGPSKIDLAGAAWHETSFHIPRKAETILEWCLTRLLKDGTRPP